MIINSLYRRPVSQPLSKHFSSNNKNWFIRKSTSAQEQTPCFKVSYMQIADWYNLQFLYYRLHVNQIIPETYRLDVPAEREEFFENYKGKLI